MKKMLVALSMLGIVGICSPTLAQNWHPISHITEKEASLIERTVAVLKIPVDFSQAEYYRLDGDYVALRLPYEDRFIGPLSPNIGKHSTENSKENNVPSTRMPYINNNVSPTNVEKINDYEFEGEKDCNLSKLIYGWSENPDDISDENLQKIDNFVNTAVRLCPLASLNIMVLGSRGNRFIKYIDSRSFSAFSVQDLSYFWGIYIVSERARTIDLPTIEDIEFAIQQIREIVLNNPSYNSKLFSTTSAIIRIYDRETWELLRRRKLIY